MFQAMGPSTEEVNKLVKGRLVLMFSFSLLQNTRLNLSCVITQFK